MHACRVLGRIKIKNELTDCQTRHTINASRLSRVSRNDDNRSFCRAKQTTRCEKTKRKATATMDIQLSLSISDRSVAITNIQPLDEFR
jgi:hypothetical protein